MFMVGLGVSTPPRRYSQRDCWEALANAPQSAQLAPRSRALLKKVLLNSNGIVSRHLALDSLSQAFDLTPDALYARFANHAPSLAADAAFRAMRQAEVTAAQVDALLISTCTGYLCPGLTSHVSERLRLRQDALLLDLVGQGCGAALPNLRTAEALLVSRGCQRVLSVCVEVCSAAFFLDDDPGVLISACLFGDGAAAAVLSAEPPTAGRRVRWRTAESLSAPADRETLRFEQRGGMLRNILSEEVPDLAAAHSVTIFSRALARANVARDEVNGWILHAAGRDVLAALRERLGLDEAALQWSKAVLLEHGNLSSASVLFVLDRALSSGAPGGLWWMSSFGAGFSCHGALLEVE